MIICIIMIITSVVLFIIIVLLLYVFLQTTILHASFIYMLLLKLKLVKQVSDDACYMFVTDSGNLHSDHRDAIEGKEWKCLRGPQGNIPHTLLPVFAESCSPPHPKRCQWRVLQKAESPFHFRVRTV